jgi:AraC-like DNA-binding protein
VYNFYNFIAGNPGECRQLNCGESLFTLFTCPLKSKLQDLWSHNNYIMYVIEGRKVWHTSNGSYDLKKGSCVFVRKGASIVEQFLESKPCFFLFFTPDEFICDVLKRKSRPIHQPKKNYDSIISIENSVAVHSFFQSMMPYFDQHPPPDDALLELKFRELILTIADNPANTELLSYFQSLLLEPQSVSLKRVMEENFSYNLKLEEFARLSSRSLSAFKRDFEKIYEMSPGKWLMEKRLTHALHLLSNMGRSVGEAAFESGFESQAHFSRAFRQRFGAPPVSMKKQITA